jgi:HEAT repeat protein
MSNVKFTGIAVVLSGWLLAGCVTSVTTPPDAPEHRTASNVQEREAIEKLKVPRRFKDDLLRLYDADPVERAWGAYQISKQGAAAAPAVPYLTELLDDDNEVLLSRYLGSGFHSSAATTPADEAARALAKIGTPAVDALTQKLKDPNPQVRRRVTKALGQTGSMSTVDALLQTIEDPDPRVRAAAAIALGSLRHPIVAQRLMDAYASTPPDRQSHLIYAMSQINDIIVVPFLIEQYASANADTRAAIVLALGKLRDARAIELLLKAVQDEDEIVRANAAFGLGAFYTEPVMSTLLFALDDSVEGVRNAAVESLRALSGLDFGQDKQKWNDWWQHQRDAIKPAGEIHTPAN